MDRTKIDWCDSTWNPVTGCLHGCEYCYARGIANRFGLDFAPKLGDVGMEGACKYDSPEGLDTMLELEKPYVKNGKAQPYPMAFFPTFHRYRLNDYIGKKGRNIFVCSMGDLFGEWVPKLWIVDVIGSCMENPNNNYLFLTKNPKRYREPYIPTGFPALWFGTTVTKKSEISRVYETSCCTNSFVSIEPLLEDLELRADDRFFRCTDWVILGAETGRRKGKVIPKREWIEKIVNECKQANIPIFMKESLAEIWGETLIQEFPEQLETRS